MDIASALMEEGRHEAMVESAKAACGLLRGLANETRLMILCMLAEGEKPVGELEARRLR